MWAFFEPKREAFLLFLVHSLPDYYSLTIKYYYSADNLNELRFWARLSKGVLW